MKHFRELNRVFKHKRIRKSVVGTTDRPRLCVHRSLNNFYAQIIDDTTKKIFFGMSTLSKELKDQVDGGNVEGAATFGEAFGTKVKKLGITKVSFDRGGYIYHGRIKAFAEGARKGGLEF